MKNLVLEKVANGFIVREQTAPNYNYNAVNMNYVPDRIYIFEDLDDVNDFVNINFGVNNEESV